ncbi:NAD-glutamate dehydrogenase [Legionella saoudiensis]|uniref:NAD-glutamate dehydrogenase n=1 Tax=Legionella saoudiensis TaxID=1750561 RepID=UPI00073162AD|nr:NAD-glutamate dehydrogenase domain-containing protein [Legionella saoudiensis]
MDHSWKEQLSQQLEQQVDAQKFVNALSMSYCEQHTVEEAASDLFLLDQLSIERSTIINFYESTLSEYPLHVKIYRFGSPIPLSDILPMLENMGLRTYTERPYKIVLNEQQYWISDFNVTSTHSSALDIEQLKDIFSDALLQITRGACEDDGFNKLVLGAGLSWRELNIIRAYAKYMHQVGFRFSQQYLEKIIDTHASIAKMLIQLFSLKFSPEQNAATKKAMEQLEHDIQTHIDAISSLDEDYIIRYFWSLIKATLRTNYYQNIDGHHQEYLSFKLDSAKVPDLPPGQPMFEIYVYSPRFEGIHLRSAKVSRGGIRWSERPEDFRTEILGLMKAQKVKNSVIVPSGAKGGFILKRLDNMSDREQIKQEVVSCYKLFIKGLLDLTDNLVEDKIVPPANTVCYDEADPYLVVAADKGTATFSDIANGISKEFNFWLGDAFASGGSAGYDHKKMGITARGAWESIKRHFRELDINFAEQEFTVVGIGDMSGDVFGNGLTYSRNSRLLAAFDHRHIFLDPNPDAHKSFDERVRLFNLPTSSWEDYNPELISTGGGVYRRTLKSIPLSPEIKQALDISQNSLPPNELIKAILRAPVDLLFNGGIGTYVKASTESNMEVGDKTNEFCRINGSELRCRVVGEGGNLGFTQLGRVEYALNGGHINTDSIDNSAGVNCSDHEVNIKILLNKEMNQGKLTEEKRNKELFQMTDEVAQLVLQDNYNQALVLGFSAANTVSYSGLYQSYIKELEKLVNLDRNVEFLPDDKKLIERKASGQGLTRPELSILMAYTKIYITSELLKSDLPDDPYFIGTMETSFPSLLTKLYAKQMEKHRLRREIIATQLSNQIVNTVGITFMYRLQIETGLSIANIARAYTLAAKAYGLEELHELIDSLNYKVSVQTQYELLHHVRQLMNLSARWFLHHGRLHGDLASNIEHYKQSIKKLETKIPSLMAGITKDYLDKLVAQFVGIGIAEETAKKIAATRAMYTALNVVEVATQNQFDLERTAEVYFTVGSKFNLVWFRDQIALDSREGHWNSLARVSLREDLDNLQRRITIAILKEDHQKPNAEELIDSWLANNRFIQNRWEQLLEMLLSSQEVDYTQFFIALRELSTLISRES